MSLLKSKKTASVWGAPSPKQLLEIFSYLNAHGFVGPIDAASLYNIDFTNAIDEDLEFWCSINRAGADLSKKEFYFSTSFGVSSKSLLHLSRQAKLFQVDFIDPKEYAKSIYSVELAHLKWNAEGGDINPAWIVSSLPEFENSALDWIRDWEKYAVPVMNAITDLNSVIQFGLQIMHYQRNPWVKSNGWTSAALEPYLAMLMLKNKQKAAAKELLLTAISTSKRPAVQAQLRLVLDWIDQYTE